MTTSFTSQPEVTKTPLHKRVFEKFSHSKRAKVGAIIAGALLAEGFISATQVLEEPTAVELAFAHRFTADGLCLDGSVYDGDNGATITPEDANVGDTITVTPEHPSAHWPVLTLIFTGDKPADFNLPIDNQETAALLSRECS